MLLQQFKTKSSPFVLAPSLVFRGSFGLFVLLLLFVVIYYGGISIVGFLMIAICLFGTFYQESWRVDTEKRELSFKTGLIFLYKKYSYQFDHIKQIHLQQFVKGILPKSDKPGRFGRVYYKLLVGLKNGTEVTIETLPKRSKQQLENWARELNELVLGKK